MTPFLRGEPIPEPVVTHRPYVMNMPRGRFAPPPGAIHPGDIHPVDGAFAVEANYL